jgi:3'(2'), 5'-bisphosphate nucleotidase
MTDQELLELAFSLAAQAGDAILAIRSRGFETMHKADASLVTEADHKAEALILAGLRAATPGIPAVAEEEMAGGAAR